jgi:hypothetical protein
MKLISVLPLNESTHPTLAAWEEAAKKAGYKVTKDNKSGTYHAWDGTSHKGSFKAGSDKGTLAEATAPRKGTVAWEREQQRKQKDRDPEEIKRIEKIGDQNHQVGNAKVTHKDVTEANKHSFVGKIQRGNELKKKVDTTFKDIGDAQKKGDHAEAGKAFRKHERYANLERPGTWMKVKEDAHDTAVEWFKANKPAKCKKCESTDFYRTSHAHTQKIVCSRCGTVAATKEITEAVIAEYIVKHGAGYRLVSKKTGKNLGDFPTKAAAEKHEREVEYFKHQNESVTEASHAADFKSETDTMKPGTKKYVGRKDGKEVHAKKDEQGNVKFYYKDGIKGQLKRVAEGLDPQDAKSKWTVTYDTYGSNKDVPLKKGATKTVYADTADAACAEIKKLVGGRNHKAECIRKPL